MKPGAAVFHDLCFDADPAAHLRSLSDERLRSLLLFLQERNQERGIAGDVWAEAIAEASRRFVEGGARA